MFGIDSFNTTPILPIMNLPSHSFTLHTENRKTFLASTKEALLTDWQPATNADGYAYSLMGIKTDGDCATGGADGCATGPFTQFTIRGKEGDASQGKWYWTGNSINLNDWDDKQPNGDNENSGGLEIDIRDGYMVELQITLANATHGKDFKSGEWSKFDTTNEGVLAKTDLSTTVLMKGGDKLSIDIDDQWSGTTNFYLKVQGERLAYEAPGDKLINDDITITLLNVYVPIPLGSGSGGGSGSGSGSGSGTGGCMDDTADNYDAAATVDDGSCEYPQAPLKGGNIGEVGGMGMGTMAIIGVVLIGGAVVLLK